MESKDPSTVIWSEPGERLRIHVLNADHDPHSLHVHGLVHGIDSDGSWPMGVAASDGRRSDAICPDEQWCYTFDVTRDTVGAWPFHDHVHEIEAMANRGLFGAIIVRDHEGPKPDIEIPFFLHRMLGSGGDPLFDSGVISGRRSFLPYLHRSRHIRLCLPAASDERRRARGSRRSGHCRGCHRGHTDSGLLAVRCHGRSWGNGDLDARRDNAAHGQRCANVTA